MLNRDGFTCVLNLQQGQTSVRMAKADAKACSSSRDRTSTQTTLLFPMNRRLIVFVFQCAKPTRGPHSLDDFDVEIE